MLVKQSLISNFTNSSLQFLPSEYKSKSPKNITIGIRYFCTSYINAIYCNPLPIQISLLLSSLLTSHPITQLISLDNALAVLITDTISAVVQLLERDMNRLVVEARESLEPVKLQDEGQPSHITSQDQFGTWERRNVGT